MNYMRKSKEMSTIEMSLKDQVLYMMLKHMKMSYLLVKNGKSSVILYDSTQWCSLFIMPEI